MSHTVCFCTVNVEHEFNPVSFALRDRKIENGETVQPDQVRIGSLIKVCGRVYAVFPIKHKLCRNRNTQKIETTAGCCRSVNRTLQFNFPGSRQNKSDVGCPLPAAIYIL